MWPPDFSASRLPAFLSIGSSKAALACAASVAAAAASFASISVRIGSKKPYPTSSLADAGAAAANVCAGVMLVIFKASASSTKEQIATMSSTLSSVTSTKTARWSSRRDCVISPSKPSSLASASISRCGVSGNSMRKCCNDADTAGGAAASDWADMTGVGAVLAFATCGMPSGTAPNADNAFKRALICSTASWSTLLPFLCPSISISSTSFAVRNASTCSEVKGISPLRIRSSKDSRTWVTSVISLNPNVAAPPFMECAVRKMASRSSESGAAISTSSNNLSFSASNSAASSKKTW
ncbi:hypothetical protein GALL_547950 [mine drainage metagenome]|uniref:Uncharacterized protein n=1 Tax=mine drainage metagenome TaxID=410659 RepID=A0A1J5NZI5_9ZZZZ